MDLNNQYVFNKQWAKSVEKFDNGIFNSYLFEDEKGICTFGYIKRDISDDLIFLDKNKYFDIITPFDYGGFYYTNDDTLEKALKEFEKKCKEENIISGFFRFNPLLNQNYKILDKYIDIVKIQEHIKIDLKSDYTQHFSKRKLRNIKSATKYDYNFIDNDSVDNFHKVYIETMLRINANDYFKFDSNVLNNLKEFANIFSIEFENKTVSSIFIIEDKDEIYYFLGGTLSEYLNYGFNSLLFALVFKYYENTKKIFFLGGGKDGLYQYKSEFSTNTAPFYIGKKIFHKDIYDKIVIQTNRENNDFFPQYRKKII